MVIAVIAVDDAATKSVWSGDGFAEGVPSATSAVVVEGVDGVGLHVLICLRLPMCSALP
jgi:hypothetical protein